MMQIALGHLCSLSRAGVRCIRSSDPRMAVVVMNDGLQAKESTRNGTEPPSRDTSHRTLPHPKPSGSKALEPRSAVASKGSETGIRLRLESLDASRRSPTRPQKYPSSLHAILPGDSSAVARSSIHA